MDPTSAAGGGNRCVVEVMRQKILLVHSRDQQQEGRRCTAPCGNGVRAVS